MDPQQKKQTPNSKSQVMYDPLIIPRVKQYLEENVHQRYLDVGVMATRLQERYRDYTRRKSAPFRQLVEQAYKTVLHSYGLDSNPSSDAEDDDDLEVMEDPPAKSDPMNSMLTNMYMDNRPGAGPAAAGAPAAAAINELIDISSDEDDDVNDNDKARKKAADNNNKTQLTQRHGDTIITVVPSKEKTAPTTSIPTNPMSGTAAASASNAAPDANNHAAAIEAAFASLTEPTAAKKRKTNHNADATVRAIPAIAAVGRANAASPGINNAPVNLQTGTSNGSENGVPTARQSSAASASTSVGGGGAVGGGAAVGKVTSARNRLRQKFQLQESPYRFDDLGGMDGILRELCELLLHIKHTEVYRHIGLPPPRGFLLHGPPGCGKTLLAQAIAGQLDVLLIQVAATELIAGISGESEERIRELFEQAAAVAPCVLFIDEIDAISSNRQTAHKDMERRIVAQLLSSMDGLSKHPHGDQVVVIGATNRLEALDPALRRVGRFDQEISLGIPDRAAREQILRVICTDLCLSQPFDYDWIAALTPGYVGADLMALASRAAAIAIRRAFGAKADMKQRHKNARRAAGLAAAAKAAKAAAEVANGPGDGEEKTGDVAAVVADEIAVTVDLMEVDEKAVEEPPIVADAETAVATSAETDVTTAKPTESDAVEPMVTDDEATAKVVEPEAEKTEARVEPEKTESPAEDKTEATEVNKETPATVANESEKSIETSVAEMDNAKQISDSETSTTTSAIPVAVPDEPAVDSTPAVATADAPVAAVIPTEDIVDLSDEESFSEALLKNPSAHLALSLDEMIGWLTFDQPIIEASELKDLTITMNDFCAAVKVMQPSAKREGFITVPDVTWDDIGALRDIREELQLSVLAPVRFPQKLKALGLKSPSGVLLCGPPGCGKTLLAKAVANEAGINFISVKGPELLNMYVGESERAVRQCFQRARNSAPCVIFFDEFDALCPTRSGGSENTSSSRVVNQLLTEMDGVEDRKGVYLMAATNRPDIVDPAVLRPGRLDKILYVGLPGEQERAEILKALTKKAPQLDADVSYVELAALTNNFTGADLAGLVRQASLQALKQSISSALATAPVSPIAKKTAEQPEEEETISVRREHFVRALALIRPSVSEEDKRHYLRLQKKYTVMPAEPAETSSE